MIEEIIPRDRAMWSPVEYKGGGDKGDGGPCARAKHSATLLGGHVYVLGGRGAGGNLPLRDFWRYTIATGAWERLTCRGEGPPSLQEHSATAHGDRLYVFGGEATALSAETPLWILDTQTQFWRKLPGHTSCPAGRRRGATRAGRGTAGRGAAGPGGRRGHSAHALKDCLLIYGGYKDLRGSTNELWAFHYESESWTQVRPGGGGAGPARHRHAAALHAATLYVHAGRCDLRLCADLWAYDTISRVWTPVRTPSRPAPAARAGHAAVRAGSHLYIFGGDSEGQPDNDMWRFHFGTESWERIVPSVRWPRPRVDACALLVGGAWGCAPPPCERAAPPARAPASLLSRLAALQVRRPHYTAHYSALGERDSTESLARESMNKSRSAHMLRAEGRGGGLQRDPLSVPDFADVPRATTLVHLDSDSEGEGGRVQLRGDTVRYARHATDSEGEGEGEFSTSDYASAEGVNRLSGFSNPHYLGPDVRALAALTPDSGVAREDIELRPLRAPAPAPAPAAPALHLLLVGGREAPHAARLQGPLSMWTYRLL